ncbi:MAG: sulfotransferase [bacterium]
MYIPLWQQWITRLSLFSPSFFTRLGSIETALFADKLTQIPIKSPIFISGLARCGSSILLQLLYQQGDSASFRYQDYPFICSPILWHFFTRHATQPNSAAVVERLHQDGLGVSVQSPESFDEVIWKAFFPDLHCDNHSVILDARHRNKAFDSFYTSSIKKMLYIHRKDRFVCKNNYHFTRRDYLLNLFPDAKFILLVRDPYSHIASLMKQHALLCKLQTEQPAIRRQFKHLCHFEFGCDRKALELDNPAAHQRVLDAWRRNDDVAGWAQYWAMVYGYLVDTLRSDARHFFVVDYQQLCQDSKKTLSALYRWLNLPISDVLLDKQAQTLQLPSYYSVSFSKEENAIISEYTHDTYKALLRFSAKFLVT